MGIFKKRIRINKERLKFEWRYFMGQTPWDTNITPPEVIEFLNTANSGRALDLGCGTGTNAIALARNGWVVTGVDFSGKAIARAVQKAKDAGLVIDFYTADVTELSMLEIPFDYVLDIGCLFTLTLAQRMKYAQMLKRLMNSNGCYMLYAWLPRSFKGKIRGISMEDVDALLSPELKKKKVVIGEERGHGSAWYWYEKM